jgi:RNA polymerase sigma-70 factor (ECF subfamily)
MAEQDRLDATVQLLSRFKGGDAHALSHLCDRYVDRLHAVVRLRMGARLRSKLESVDIVQEAFLDGIRGLNQFSYHSEGDFFHWLCKITENRIRDQADYFRAQKRDAARERPLEAARPSHDSVFGPIAELARHTSPASLVAQAEDLARLESAVDALPEAQREALLLVRYEGLSFPEAARHLRSTPDAVRMLVARAIVALGKSMSGPQTDRGST